MCSAKFDDNHAIWTSAINFDGQDKYYWDNSGEYVGPFTNWAEYEPKLSNRSICVRLLDREGEFQWCSAGCLWGSSYICQATK
jgi:hypothetical protein